MVYTASEGGKRTMMKKTGTILLVEDEPNILRTNRRILEREGYTVLCATNLSEARTLLQENSPDALVLDILLPDGNGLAFCEEVRPSTSAPMLFLTALDEKSDIIEGLVAGGNDYITKPYDVDEFLARVEAQLRLAWMNRQSGEKVKTLKAGPLELDTVSLHAYLHGEDMLLSAREFSLLLFMLQNQGETLSAEALYEGAWNQSIVGNASALWKCISRLKKKLENCQEEVALLTFRNKGYLLEVFEGDKKTK